MFLHTDCVLAVKSFLNELSVCVHGRYRRGGQQPNRASVYRAGKLSHNIQYTHTAAAAQKYIFYFLIHAIWTKVFGQPWPHTSF